MLLNPKHLKHLTCEKYTMSESWVTHKTNLKIIITIVIPTTLFLIEFKFSFPCYIVLLKMRCDFSCIDRKKPIKQITD